LLKWIWVFVFLFVSALIASAAIKPANFVGIWLFDEGVGGFAGDSSGNEAEGKLTGTKWVDGKFGKALQFDGAGFVNVPSNEKIGLGDQFTMMAYFYATALDGWHQLIAKDAEYLLRIDPPAEGKNMSAFVWIAGAWEPRSSAGVPDTKTWTHFAATYDSKTSALITYVDGVKKAQINRAGKPSPGANPVNIGCWGAGSYFKGILDEVAILNVALTEAEIKDIAENGLKVVLKGGQSIQPVGKLATSWGDVKNR